MSTSFKQQMRKTVDEVIARGPFDASDASLENYKCPAWYRNGKFGIFIHWGVYSVPAFGNEWYPRNMYVPETREFEHHVKTYGPQNKFGYKDFIPMFTAEKFDAAEWARLFRDAGARFAVPVAEHHDGFAMYPSALNPWNSAAMGPRRDVVGELAAAFAQHDITLGLSSHRAEHYWFFNEGMQFDSDVRDPQFASLYGMGGEMSAGHGPHPSYHSNMPSAAVQEDWLVSTCEFVEKYRPRLVWFDWWINNIGYRKPLREFLAYYYNRCAEWGIGGAINYKYQALSPEMAVFDVERGQLDKIYPLFWQNDTAVAKNSWGFTHNQEYKEPVAIIADLIDVVSKNGALLLNIGPRPDGTIPEGDAHILREIGKWLAVNGEAIYNTRPHLAFGEGPTKVAEGAFTDTNRTAFTSGDIRFTRNEDTLYAIGLARDVEGLFRSYTLALNHNYAPHVIHSVELLGHGPLTFTRDADSLRVKLPAGEASTMPFVLKLKI